MPEPTLLQRLKERKLVQWALAYLAGAWVVYEATGTALEAWDIPLFLVRSIHVFLAVGFFVTLVIAWYHGEKGRQRVSGPELLMVAALLVIAGGVLSMLGGGEEATEPVVTASPTAVEDDRPSIAVLPFQNRSGIEDDAYFTDGVHDQIITQLAKISGLSVRGLTSVLVYRDSPKNLREIGEELNARYIVEGGVQRAGEMIRINVQLIESATDEHIWASTYDRTMSAENLFSIQTEIVEAVADSVRAVVTPEERSRVQARPTENLEAYNAYLMGRYHWNRRTAESLLSAIEHFEEAIEADSAFALAYVGLADSHILLPWYEGRRGFEAYREALAAARKALEIDEESGEAHASLAAIMLFFEWDWAGAEAEFLRAIELAPNHATAHHWYGYLLGGMGRADSAVDRLRTALAVDPISAVISSDIGLMLAQAGHYEEAIEQFRKTLEMDPDFSQPRQGLALVYLIMGRYEEALEWDPDGTSAIFANRMLGRMGEARSLAASRETESLRIRIDAKVAMGDIDGALPLLEQAFQERSPWLFAIAAHDTPAYAPLHADPRWQRLLRRAGLVLE